MPKTIKLPKPRPLLHDLTKLPVPFLIFCFNSVLPNGMHHTICYIDTDYKVVARTIAPQDDLSALEMKQLSRFCCGYVDGDEHLLIMYGIDRQDMPSPVWFFYNRRNKHVDDMDNVLQETREKIQNLKAERHKTAHTTPWWYPLHACGKTDSRQEKKTKPKTKEQINQLREYLEAKKRFEIAFEAGLRRIEAQKELGTTSATPRLKPGAC